MEVHPSQRFKELLLQLAAEHDSVCEENQKLSAILQTGCAAQDVVLRANCASQDVRLEEAVPATNASQLSLFAPVWRQPQKPLEPTGGAGLPPSLDGVTVTLTAEAAAPQALEGTMGLEKTTSKVSSRGQVVWQSQASPKLSLASDKTSHQNSSGEMVPRTESGPRLPRSNTGSLSNKSARIVNIRERVRRGGNQDRSLKSIRHSYGSISSLSVDDLDELTGFKRFRCFLHRMLSLRKFDTAMGCVILLNSVIIGCESTSRLHGDPHWVFGLLEHAFLIIYVAELVARLLAYGKACLKSSWVRFDAALVIIGMLGSWVVAPIVELAVPEASRNSDVDGALSPVLVLRLFRLFRLARALRLLVQFRTLWMLVQGLINSGSTIFYTFCLMSMLLYIFSCIGLEMITIPWAKEEGVFGDLVRHHWSNIPRSMLTLVRFANLDSIATIYEPMIDEHLYLAVYFMSFLLLVSIGLMNLVTAVIVEGALEQARHDKHTRLQHKRRIVEDMMPELRRDLVIDDTQGPCGMTTLEQVVQLHTEVVSELNKCLGGHSLVDLFFMVDETSSGEIEIEEFCDFVLNMATSETPFEVFLMMRQLKRMQEDIVNTRKLLLDDDEANAWGTDPNSAVHLTTSDPNSSADAGKL